MNIFFSVLDCCNNPEAVKKMNQSNSIKKITETLNPNNLLEKKIKNK